MKTIAVLLLSVIITSDLFSGDKYLEVMKKNIDDLYAAKVEADIQNVANAFERIGSAEKNRWEPFYYAAFAYVQMAIQNKEATKKDAYLDQATKALENAKAIAPSEPEVVSMEGFIHMIRVTVDPPSRGQQYSGLAFHAFSKAVALDPENPRALTLLAQMQYGTAQFFGSPTTEACATLDKALEKFNTYPQKTPISPNWGQEMATELKEQCK